MNTQDTNLSLLRQVQNGDERAWQRLVNFYEPLVGGWARKHAPMPEDAEDLAQEILLQVVRHLSHFEHRGRRGSFRTWLRTLAIHTTCDFWKARQRQPRGIGGTDVLVLLHQLQDSASDLTQAWDREHDQVVLNRLLEQVRDEFQPASLQAFFRQALDGIPAETVAQELNLSVGAVYTAKSRVLRRLRQLSEGLLDWEEGIPGKLV